MITLYTKPNCPHCNAAKNKLNNAGVDYQTINLAEDTDALAMVKDYGFTQAPVIQDKDLVLHMLHQIDDAIKKETN